MDITQRGNGGFKSKTLKLFEGKNPLNDMDDETSRLLEGNTLGVDPNPNLFPVLNRDRTTTYTSGGRSSNHAV